jgi:hypothetical protein
MFTVEQIIEADRNACHALFRKGKAHAKLRRLNSAVIATRSRINDSFIGIYLPDKTCCFPSSTLPGQLMYGAAIIG